MIVDRIEAFLEAQGDAGERFKAARSRESSIAARAVVSFLRQVGGFSAPRAGELHGSGPWPCPRKLRYAFEGQSGETPEARTRMNWLLGDIAETALLETALAAGVSLEVPSEPAQVELGARKAICHADAFYVARNEVEEYLVGEPDKVPEVVHLEKGDSIPVEVKSMNEIGYARFLERGMDDTWGYRTQGDIYCLIRRSPGTLFIALNKNTGHIAEHYYPFDPDRIERASETVRLAIENDLEDIPRLPLEEEPEGRSKTKTTGRKLLGLLCSYCEFKRLCWGGLKVEFVSTRTGSRPVFIVPDAQPVAADEEVPF